MRTFVSLIVAASMISVAKSSCSYEDTCSVSGFEGVCVSVSAGCCNGGTVTSNLCPGSSDIKCCTQAACSTPSGAGTCMQTSKCRMAGGTSFSGYCVGPTDLQCCVDNNDDSVSPIHTDDSNDGVYGVDFSDAISLSIASCLASAGNSFVVPRGYHSYGEVDTGVCTSIINAADAGIKTRDTYMFPC